jgi:hypothetical protein
MATVKNKRNILNFSIEGKVSDTRNRKWQRGSSYVSGNWPHKFYDFNHMGKQNHSY